MKLFASLFGAVLLLSACGGGGNEDAAPAEESEQEVKEYSATGAEEVFQANCASCHGQQLGGGSGPGLTQVGTKYSEEEILSIIQNGKGIMPPKVIEGQEAEHVAKWLSTME
ncbi:cytochrome c551 [Pontibacillus halophilus]